MSCLSVAQTMRPDFGAKASMADTRVLVVGGDIGTVHALVQELERGGLLARGVTYDAGVLGTYQAETFELVLVHVPAHGAEGMKVLASLISYDPEALVAVLSTHATVDLAVEALKAGAAEFIEGPLAAGELAARVRQVVAQRGEKAVHGSLRDLSLTSIISVNCSEHNQAELVIHHQGRVGIIYFESGGIVHASLDDEEGEQAIYELLSWEDGSFSLKQGVPPPKRTVAAGWTGLLLEGMRRIDDAVEDWQPDDEYDAAAEEPSVERMATALKAVEGVESVVVCARGGGLLGEASCSEPATKAALTALLGQRSRSLAFVLNAGRPRSVCLGGTRGRVLVVPYGEDYVGVWISLRSSPESIATEVRNVLRRYPQAKGGSQ
jgi:FixJ family two-component response regulator/predicted regulator of Ras-like GTPase activity (Roadblock/LC7/MglB family)